jgi:hypothetical protein
MEAASRGLLVPTTIISHAYYVQSITYYFGGRFGGSRPNPKKLVNFNALQAILAERVTAVK